VLVCPHCGQQNPAGARFCNACAAPLAADGPNVRKTVSIVRCDVTGSTALGERIDPEPLREIMTRYYDEMRSVIERHGGMVEKFIGDAVMGIFGIPVLHEDDALRAVRAAGEMREALRELNQELSRERGVELSVRTAVMTGEVMASEPAGGQAFVIGDAANVVARLETSAQPGEILIGEPTHRLVAGAVEAEPAGPFTAKGKAEPLRAWRLLAVRPGAQLVARRLDSSMVGRARELEALMAVYERSRIERTCQLVTILGAPGIGKSRLSEELAGRAGGEALVLRGRCLPYGEGITYWPLTEMLRALPPPAELLDGEADAELVARRVAAAVGAAEGGAPSEETFWAVRRLFERLARETPLVVLIDDLQWAEPTFLELLEHVAYLSRATPILLVGLARNEFLDIRPGWPGPRIRLEPLLSADAETLLNNLAEDRAIGADVRARIAAAAEGNPLFIEQLLAMLEADGVEAAVPPTIQALLASRVDQLDGPPRRALECASVVGQRFWSAALREMAGGDAAIGRALVDLVRLEFIVPDEAVTFPDEDGFRFVHILVRDAAYEAMPMAQRSELHKRFAAWIERKDEQQAVRHEAIGGYHLEQAARYLEALGPAGDHSRRLAREAAERLLSAARNALARADMPAAANLFGRAADLLPRDDPARLRALPELADALVGTGELAEARELLDEALRDARTAGDEAVAAHARLALEDVLLLIEPEGFTGRIPAVTADAIRIFEELSDEAGLARAWLLRSQVEWIAARGAESALERALVHAERSGSRSTVEIRRRLVVALSRGPAPIDEVLPRCELILARYRGEPLAEIAAAGEVAFLEALRGNFGRASGLLAQREALVAEIGIPLAVAISKAIPAKVAMLAGDPATAEGLWREACNMFKAIGERGFLSTRAAELAEKALYAQGKHDEAERFALLGRDAGASDDVETQARWRGAMAKVLARRGEHPEAARLVREAVHLVEPTDGPELRGDVLMDAAETFRLASDSEEAAALARRAEATFAAKGMTVLARNAAAFGADLVAARPNP
jgi:class 3 adenylate cyclase/tetratricopeptide (TPR) repeat protein